MSWGWVWGVLAFWFLADALGLRRKAAAIPVLFQNPRLSLEGLDFYYRNFYDGPGEAAVRPMFAAQREHYLARGRMLQGIATPTRWLDVGGGHGDFCHAAGYSS
jgi:hypothetical protein